MSVTAFAAIISEIGDFAEAVVRALSEHTLIDRTKTVTSIAPGGKRKPEVHTTITTTYKVSAFHLLFVLVVTGAIKWIRDRDGNMILQFVDLATTPSFFLTEDWAQGPVIKIIEELLNLEPLSEEASDEVIDYMRSIADPLDIIPVVESEEISGVAEGVIEGIKDVLVPIEVEEEDKKKIIDILDPLDLLHDGE